MVHLTIHTNHLPADFSDCDPQEEALLRAEVAATLVACPVTAIQTAVTVGRWRFQQDWRQEARKLLHEFGLPTCTTPMSHSVTR